MVNEEFASLRHRIFAKAERPDGGSHHSIPYSDFEKSVQQNGFGHQYFVADHLRQKLSLPGAVALLETFPALLKQMKSALIILNKLGTGKSFPNKEAEKPVLQA